MSAVITNIDDLEFVWRAASDGFSAGIDFKVWLANSVIELRADLQAAQERIAQLEAAQAFSDAEQARQLDAARIMISMINQKTYLKRDLQVEVNHWLAANPAPKPQPPTREGRP